MGKLNDIFNDISVNGTSIDLDELENNNGIYHTNESNKLLNVNYSLKNTDTINSDIFQNNTCLKSIVNIPKSIKKIDDNAFNGTSLSTIKTNLINNKNINISKSAFINTKLTNLTINKIINTSNMKQVTLLSNKTFASQVSIGGRIYIINNTFNLNGATVKLPKNCILIFTGGSLVGGILVGDNSYILVEGDYKIFNNVRIEGSWTCPGIVTWFASCCTVEEINNNTQISRVNQTSQLQLALDSSFRELIFPPVAFYITNTLVLKKEKKLTFQGSRMDMPIDWQGGIGENPLVTMQNTSIIFTDANIDVLHISVTESKYHNKVEINGGNFDVSLCQNYTKSVIKVLADTNQTLWGLYIKTNIIGKYNSETGVGIDLNPYLNQRFVEGKPLYVNPNSFSDIPSGKTALQQYKEAIGANFAFITNVRIDSDISFFGTGVKAKHWGNDKNWLTDLTVSGYIRFCPIAVDTDADCTIDAGIQAGYYWNEQNNNHALIYVRGGDTTAAIGSVIYDIYQPGDSKWSNRYAVIVEDKNGGDASNGGELGSSIVVPYGRFAAFLIGGGHHNVSFTKGRVYQTVLKDNYYYGGTNTEKPSVVIRYNDPLFNQLN